MKKIKLTLSTIVIALCGIFIFIGGVKADTVSTEEQFLNKIADSDITEIKLASDITINTEAISFKVEGKDRVLDLNGYTLNIDGEFRPSYYSSNSLSITDSGVGGKFISTARIYPENYTSQDVSLIVNNGTYIISSEYIFTDCGYFNLVINDGVFKASKSLVAFSPSYASTVTLNKLEFSARDNSPYSNIVLAFGKTNDITLGEGRYLVLDSEIGRVVKSLDDIGMEVPNTNTFKVLKKYSLSFDTNKGNNISDQLLFEDELTKKPDNPIREGYKFDDWYTNSNFSNKYTFGKTISENITLYAKWKGNLENQKIAPISVTVAKTYTGKAQTQNLIVKHDGKTLVKGIDYTISYDNNINAGNGRAKVIIKGIGNYTGTRTKYFTINKAKNPVSITYKNKKVKYKKVKKKSQSVSSIFVKNAKGNVEYSKVSGSKKLKVNKRTGKITVKKKTKKGTYKIKVKVNCKGTNNYKALVKTVSIKIKVK